MLSNTFFGCSIFLITNTSLLYTSHLLIRRFLPQAPPAVRWVATGTLFYAFIILIFQALSPFYAITKIWVTVSSLLSALLSHSLWGKTRNFKAEIDPIRIWLRDGLSSRWAVLIIICGFVVLLSLSRSLLMPPLSWDSLTYHLTFAALWIKKGTLLLFTAPDQIAENVHFPINGDIFSSWFLLPFHNDLLVNTVNFPITFLGGLSCYALARELGLNRKEAGFAPLLLCFAPMIYSQITTSYTDNAVFACGSASALFTLRYLRKGHLYDAILSFVAAGILLGIKFTGIPVVAIILITTILKTVRLTECSGFIKKISLIICGMLILCTLGGRHYILNTLEAGNPIYPFPLKVFNHEIFEGSSQLELINEWVTVYEKEYGWEKFSWWEKEYRRFSYASRTAGPKFLPILMLVFISLFIKPGKISRRDWYFLASLWIVPIILFYATGSADFTRRASWIEGSTRFLSFPIAIFTIQGLFTLKKFSNHSKIIDFLLVALVAWDLTYCNTSHPWRIEIVYPFLLLVIPLIIIGFQLIMKKPKKISRWRGIIIARPGATYSLAFISLIIALYFLQDYRDTTRYHYYHEDFDYVDIPRNWVNGWEFLDQHDRKKTIAMTVGWEAPGHKWFFYPLLGKYLQNDIVYISAKRKLDVHTWLDRSLLRGNDVSIWLYNLEREKVDYIFVAKPWPIELSWMLNHQDEFQLVFSDNDCNIFKYRRKIS